ncbi:MAG: glycosyltransferase family 2 protein [Planctomycetia bacterium]
MGYTILIPVKQINEYLRESVPCILALDHSDFEVVILPDELPSEPLPEVFDDPRITISATGSVSPAVKRDLGAQRARFSRLAFLDDDAFPRQDWLRRADEAFRKTGAVAVGGPGVTPPGSPPAEVASAIFFETLIGGGGMAYRYLPAANGFWVDDFPTVNLLVEKSAFDSVGGFDSAFWPGEDTKFCLDLLQAGHRIWYAPDVVVYHHRRRVLGPHLKQVGNYGRHRGYFARTLPETSLRATYFVPSLFVLGSVSLIGLGFVLPALWKLYAVLMLIYFAWAALEVLRRTRDPLLVVMSIATIFCSHVTYGVMFLRGLLSPSSFQSQLR